MPDSDEGARLDCSTGALPARARPVPPMGSSRWWDLLVGRWWYVRPARDLGVNPFPLLAALLADSAQPGVADSAQPGVTKSRPGLLRRLASRMRLNHA